VRWWWSGVRADQSEYGHNSCRIRGARRGWLTNMQGQFTARNCRSSTRKLDRYMARKNRRGRNDHLLIDRFRFGPALRRWTRRASNLLNALRPDGYCLRDTRPNCWSSGLGSGASEFAATTKGQWTLLWASRRGSTRGFPIGLQWVRRQPATSEFNSSFLEQTR